MDDKNNHTIDALRYACVSGLSRACTAPVVDDEYSNAAEGGWMGR